MFGEFQGLAVFILKFRSLALPRNWARCGVTIIKEPVAFVVDSDESNLYKNWFSKGRFSKGQKSIISNLRFA